MAISDLTKLSVNHEISRVEQLIPSQLRRNSGTFIEFLKEYYRFMNQTEDEDLTVTTAGPSFEISRANEQHDLDLVDEKYLNEIKNLIGAYVPNSAILNNRILLKRIVKYFYNTRGSRESVETFFRLFFNSSANIEKVFLNSLRNEVPASMGSTYQNIYAKKWLPYSYYIETDVPVYKWKDAYKTLIHPVGWKFNSILRIETNNTNDYLRFEANYTDTGVSKFNYDSLLIEKWFIEPPYGSHTPISQQGLILILKQILETQNETYFFKEIEIAKPAAIHFSYTTSHILNHLDYIKEDYLTLLKFEDYGEIGGYSNVRIDIAEQEYIEEDNQVQDFTNVSSIIIVTPNKNSPGVQYYDNNQDFGKTP